MDINNILIVAHFLYLIEKEFFVIIGIFLAAGDELTVDYATYMNTIPDFECWCGTSVCRRRIQSDEYKEKWFQDRYGSHVSPYILMLVGIEKMTSSNSSS